MSGKVKQELYQSQIPSKPSADLIKTHEIWYRQVKALNQRKKDIMSDYEVKRQELIQQGHSELTSLRENAMKLKQKEVELRQHEQHRLLLHTHLLELRQQQEISQLQQDLVRQQQQLAQDQYNQELLQKLQMETKLKHEQVKREYKLCVVIS